MTKRDYRQEVTDTIVQMLEKGVAPWQKPWVPGAFEMPFNPVGDRVYRGGNAVYLMSVAAREKFDDPRWITYKQARAHGWQVREGAKGTHIEYWEFPTGKMPQTQAADGPASENGKDKSQNQPRLVHRLYTVFNAKQIEGIPPHQPKQRETWQVVQSAEQILQYSGASIAHDQNDKAFYSRATDSIHMPPKGAFKAPADYYGTALHELAHWTGHSSRLDRETLNTSSGFGDRAYAREELRAELASVFLAAERGIPHNTERHAAYVHSWIEALKSDKHEIFRASKDASRASGFLLALEREQSVAKALEAVNGQGQRAEPSRPAAPSRDALGQSFAEARQLTNRALGESAKTFVAQTDSGAYRGEILGETQHHVIQKLTPKSAVAHMKHLLGASPAAGENLIVSYSNGRASLSAFQPKAQTKELAR